MVSIVGLPDTFIDRIKHIVQELMGSKIQTGQKAKLMIASVIYGVCRENNKPVTLLDLSNHFQFDVYSLGRMFNEIKMKMESWRGLRDIDPILFIDRVISDLFGDVEIKELERVQLCNKVFELIQFSNKFWVGTGRHPNTIIGASLYIIFLSKKPYKQYADIKTIAKSLSVTVSTLRSRYKEILAVLVKKAKELPWGSNINQKNILNHVDEVLKYSGFVNKIEGNEKKRSNESESGKHEISLPRVIHSSKKRKVSEENKPKDLESSPISLTVNQKDEKPDKEKISYPPSYEFALKKKSELQSRILSAKHRLLTLSQSFKDNPNLERFKEFDYNKCCGEKLCKKSVNEDDLKIQKLLLDGLSETVILEGYHSNLFDESSSKLLPLEHHVYDEEEEINAMIRSDDEIKNLRSILSENS